MQAWLQENKPVDGEDLERHDKWLCMMWPRLHLLRELLADDGVIFVSIDDHEAHHLRILMDDVFGQDNFIDTLILIQNLGAVPGRWLSEVNEFVHVYSKDIGTINLGLFAKEEPADGWSQDELGPYRLGAGLVRIGMSGTPVDRPNLYFPIYVGTDGTIRLERASTEDTEVYPTDGNGNAAVWRWGRNKVATQPHNLSVKPHSRMGYQFIIKIRPDTDGHFTGKPSSLWNKPQYSASTGTMMVRQIFNDQRVFDFPKSTTFLQDIITFANVGPDDIVLDSFAGSGTTAHAVLALNKEDGGNRKFILVECEDYADTITAERVRRVIKGVPGAKDKALKEGLGGTFTYCTLGETIDAEGMLTGESLPSFETLAAYLLHTARGVATENGDLAPQDDDGLFYSDDSTDYYLLYWPDVEWLSGNDAVLKEAQAERIKVRNTEQGRSAVVFAAAKYIGQRELTGMGITFCQLPYEMNLQR